MLLIDKIGDEDTMEGAEPFRRKQAATFEAFLLCARQQGSFSHQELSEVVPDNTDPDEIEDLMNMLNEMGIRSVDVEEPQ